MHENSLKFIHFLIDTAAKAGDDGMQSLEDLLARMEKTVAEAALYPVTEASLKRNPKMEKDFQTMQMLTWKATGGKFPFEAKIRATRKSLTAAHGFDHIHGYRASVEINGRTILTKPTDYGDVALNVQSQPQADPAGAVNTCEFDEAGYFIGNFKNILSHMSTPGNNRGRQLIQKFVDFLTQRADAFLRGGVFAKVGDVPEGLHDFVLIGVHNTGELNMRNMEMRGSKDVILKKYESVCRDLEAAFPG